MVASYFCSLVISNLVCSLFPLSYLRLSLATLLQIGASSNELKPRFHGLNECTTKSYLILFGDELIMEPIEMVFILR